MTFESFDKYWEYSKLSINLFKYGENVLSMQQPIDTPILTLRYSGLFDYDGLYRLVVEWMKQQGYWYHEGVYKHKVPLPTGAEQELEAYGEKEVTELVKFRIDVKFHFWDLLEMEIMKDGQKTIVSSARLEIIFAGKVIPDWQEHTWKWKKFHRALVDFYYRYVLRRNVGGYWDTLHYRVVDLHGRVKKFLDMQTKWNEYKGYLKED